MRFFLWGAIPRAGAFGMAPFLRDRGFYIFLRELGAGLLKMIRRNVIRTCAFGWIFCGFNLRMIYGSLNGVSEFAQCWCRIACRLLL